MNKSSGADKVVMTTCHNHCGSTCLLKFHVRNGIITKIETGDGEDVQFRACANGRAYRQLEYHPDRLKFPLRRTGERGEGKFEQISWDEALCTVAAQIKRVSQTYGAGSNILLCSAGDFGWFHCGGLIERLFVRFGGYTGVLGNVSGEGTWFASMATFGPVSTVSSRESLLKSRLIIMWGWNPALTRGEGGIPFYLSQIKKAGIRVISIDPRYTDSAALLAEQWVPIRPGTDAAMVIAMAYVIITENLEDRSFLEKYTIGFDKFKDYVSGKEDGVPKTPGWAQGITGVPADTIANLAREYATTKPAALMAHFSPGRSAYGEQFSRATATLAAMTGNIGIAGGSAACGANGPTLVHGGGYIPSRMNGEDNPLDLTATLRKDSIFFQRIPQNGKTTRTAKWYGGGPSTSYLNRVRLADAILKGRRGGYPYDYKLLYMVNINWLNQYANTNKVIDALKKLEFVVTQEQFLTPTAKYADIVLPTNTYIERNDLTSASLAPVYGYMAKVVDSVGESRSHFEIATGLAAKLGISDYSDKTEEEWLRETVKDCREIPDYDTFKNEGIYRIKSSKPPLIALEAQINDPAKNPFPTPSGKIEIYSQTLADMDNPMMPPIPKYIETWESRNDSLAKKYPLQLITTHPRLRVHTQNHLVPWLRELETHAMVINNADARDRGIKDGDTVRVFNDRGQMIILANVTERILPGVVDISEGAWYDPDENGIDRGGCANVLTNDEPSPGGGFCGNTVLVQVEKK